MERVRKLATTVWTHKKKSVVLAVAGGYGAKWYSKRLEDEAYFRDLSREAMTYGAGLITRDTPLYRVTVILNPVASGGKGRKYYEKYCAPLLNLAGMKVSIIRTESEGQAKDIMEIMADADAVLLAGGDGTIMEAVTGLMKRSDRAEAAKVPIGILPVGKTNSLAHSLFGVDDDVKLMGEATMSVIRHLKKPLSLIEVENRSEDEYYRGRKLYCVNRIEIGSWKDARLRTDRYWLFGFGLKNYITYLGSFTSGQKEVLWDCDLDINYLEESDGGEKVLRTETSSPSQKSNGSWVSWLLGGGGGGSKGQDVPKPVTETLSSSCEKWSGVTKFNGPQITVEQGSDKLKAVLYNGSLSIGNFAAYGWSLWKNRFRSHLSNPELPSMDHSILSSKEIYLDPNVEPGFEKQLCVDGEDAPLNAPVVIRHLRDQVTVFCDKSEAVSEVKATSDPGRAGLGRWTGGVQSSLIKNKSF